jgi:preprotein translocase subunit SecG
VNGILGLLRISWLLGVLFRLFIVVYSSTKRKEKKRQDKTVKGNEDNKEHDDEIC